jgi:hypothetical protein
MGVTIGALRDLCMERSYAVRTMLRLLLSLSVAVMMVPVVAADEVTVARIECPAQVKAKVAWPHKISEDPTYEHDSTTEQEVTFNFVEMIRSKQLIYCRYYAGGRYQVDETYFYKVKRTIVSCTPAGERILDCKVKN